MKHPIADPGAYDQMLELADAFGATGEQLRSWARLGGEILRDDDVAASAELSPPTWRVAEDDIRAASGKDGLLGRGVELDADALVVRATVLTYQWIDDLQNAAYRSVGSVAARAIGYLAPQVELGGALVGAGLIETDALDRDGITAYLGELADEHPELMDHIAGGGSLMESLQLRALLTAGLPRTSDQPHDPSGAGAGLRATGLRATGVGPFEADAGHAVRDVAGELLAPAGAVEAALVTDAVAPRGLHDLMSTLEGIRTSVDVRPSAEGRYIAYLAGPGRGRPRLRVVSGDISAYAAEADAAIAASVPAGAKVMLVGAAAGGETAARLASLQTPESHYTVEQVVIAGAPAAAAPRIPESTRVLSLEDRSDPVALLGGLINQGAPHRLTVVSEGEVMRDESPYAAAARAADSATHPALVAEIGRMRQLGYLG